MQYQSTRGASLGHFSDILLQGLAPDGGLAMPESIRYSVLKLQHVNKSNVRKTYGLALNFI